MKRKNVLFLLLTLLLSIYAFAEDTVPNISFKITRSITNSDGTVIESFTPSESDQIIWVKLEVQYTGDAKYLSITDLGVLGYFENMGFDETIKGGITVGTRSSNFDPSDDSLSQKTVTQDEDVTKVATIYKYQDSEGPFFDFSSSKTNVFRYKCTIPAGTSVSQVWQNGTMSVPYAVPTGTGTTFNPLEFAIEGQDTLLAEGAAQTYTVTYNKNDAEGTVVEKTSLNAGDYVLETAEALDFELEGKIFSGWNTSADGTGDAFDAGQTITLDGDKVFYAQWEDQTYTVTYHKNDGTEESVQKTGVPGGEYTLERADSLGFDVAGKVFAGWNTASNGEGDGFEEGATVSLDGDKDFYAVWNDVPVYFTVTYKGNGGLFNGSDEYVSEPILKGSDYTVESNKFVRTYYSFSGWQKNGAAFTDSIIKGISENVTLTAQWEQKQVVVTYNPGAGATINGKDTYTEEVAAGTKGYQVISAVPVKEGEVFVGWTYDNAIVTTLDIEEENIVLNARWETAATATITYHAAGDGAGYEFLSTTPQVVSKAAGEVTVDGNDWFKNVYPIRFAGWALSGVAGDTVAYKAGDTVTLEADENLDLYGVWEPCADVTLAGLVHSDAFLTEDEMWEALDPDTPKIVLSNSTYGLSDVELNDKDNIVVWFRVANYGFVDTDTFKVRVKVGDQYFNDGVLREHDQEGGNLDYFLEDGELLGGLQSDGYTFTYCVIGIELGSLSAGEHTITVEVDYEDEVDETISWIDANTPTGGNLDNEFSVTVDIKEAIGYRVAYNDNFTNLTYCLLGEMLGTDDVKSMQDQTKIAGIKDVFGYTKIAEWEIYEALGLSGYENYCTHAFVFYEWYDIEGNRYLPGDEITTSLELFANYMLAPQFWFYPLDNKKPFEEDAELIKVTQEQADDVLYNTRDTLVDFMVVEYNEVGTPEYSVEIKVVNTATKAEVFKETVTIPEGTSFKKFEGYSLGRLPVGNYEVICTTDPENKVVEADENEEKLLIMNDESATMRKVIRKAFSVSQDPTGYDTWPEDSSLYTPVHGKVFKAAADLSITFTWPNIVNAEGYVLTVKTYGGEVVYVDETLENSVTVTGADVDSYVWTVAAKVDGASMTSSEFTFAVIDGSTLPVIREVVGGGENLEITLEETVSSTVKCQLMFYSFAAAKWESKEVELSFENGKAVIDMDIDTAEGYLYIRSLQDGNDAKFIECYVTE